MDVQGAVPVHDVLGHRRPIIAHMGGLQRVAGPDALGIQPGVSSGDAFAFKLADNAVIAGPGTGRLQINVAVAESVGNQVVHRRLGLDAGLEKSCRYACHGCSPDCFVDSHLSGCQPTVGAAGRNPPLHTAGQTPQCLAFLLCVRASKNNFMPVRLCPHRRNPAPSML